MVMTLTSFSDIRRNEADHHMLNAATRFWLEMKEDEFLWHCLAVGHTLFFVQNNWAIFGAESDQYQCYWRSVATSATIQLDCAMIHFFISFHVCIAFMKMMHVSIFICVAYSWKWLSSWSSCLIYFEHDLSIIDFLKIGRAVNEDCFHLFQLFCHNFHMLTVFQFNSIQTHTWCSKHLDSLFRWNKLLNLQSIEGGSDL